MYYPLSFYMPCLISWYLNTVVPRPKYYGMISLPSVEATTAQLQHRDNTFTEQNSEPENLLPKNRVTQAATGARKQRAGTTRMLCNPKVKLGVLQDLSRVPSR